MWLLSEKKKNTAQGLHAHRSIKTTSKQKGLSFTLALAGANYSSAPSAVVVSHAFGLKREACRLHCSVNLLLLYNYDVSKIHDLEKEEGLLKFGWIFFFFFFLGGWGGGGGNKLELKEKVDYILL